MSLKAARVPLALSTVSVLLSQLDMKLGLPVADLREQCSEPSRKDINGIDVVWVSTLR